MEFLDARRLTGPNLIFGGPGSILDVACTPDEAEQLVPVWADNVFDEVGHLARRT